MKARVAGLILLTGISLSARAATFSDTDRDSSAPSFASSDWRQGVYPCQQKCNGGSGEFPPVIQESGNYPMLLAGLGLMAAIARRRQRGG